LIPHMVRTNLNGDLDEIEAMQLLPDGKILAAGTSSLPSTGADFALVRYNTNGSVDSTFGINGSVTTDIDSAKIDVATSIALEPDGKIVLAGRSFGGSVYQQAIVRYTANGMADTSFGRYGIVHNQVEYENLVDAVQIQSNGKIVIAGSLQNSSGISFALLARYQSENNTGIPIVALGYIYISAYPNPTVSGLFTLSAYGFKEAASIIITDVLGKSVWIGTHDFGVSAKISINISKYPVGTYNIDVVTAFGKGKTIQVIKE